MKSWSGWAHTSRRPTQDSVTIEPPLTVVDTKPTEEVISTEERKPVDGNNDDDDDEEHGNEHTSLGAKRPAGISSAEMSSVGWMVKRIFDAGRIQYLREYMGFNAHQTIYCAETLSPENVLILATQK